VSQRPGPGPRRRGTACAAGHGFTGEVDHIEPAILSPPRMRPSTGTVSPWEQSDAVAGARGRGSEYDHLGAVGTQTARHRRAGWPAGRSLAGPGDALGWRRARPRRPRSRRSSARGPRGSPPRLWRVTARAPRASTSIVRSTARPAQARLKS
jgi:hypothetical protein